MKKIFGLLVVTVIVVMGCQTPSSTQSSTDIPLDPAIRHGKLDNGMTYYIRHNVEPKERASFYFVQNVGAILEEDHQNGLAHFLEHMSFNGTQHFKGKGIINFLEKHGVGFGGDINAYTAQDETVYNLSNVPVNKNGLMDSCLLVLHDWSGYLSLEEEEIDAERGVIREEWRTRRNASFRLRSQTNPVMYKGSKYAVRDVIGDLDVINNFEYQALRDYYQTWYRPDQQAVVVVGDVDVQEMEQKIIELFSKIPLRENLPEREYYNIPDNKAPLYVQAKDKEAQAVSITMLCKKDVPAVKGEAFLKQQLVQSIYRTMMSNRFQEKLQKSTCASMSMDAGFFPMARTKDAFYLSVTPKRQQELEAFRQLMVEVERVNQHGFTQTELERTQKQLLRDYENYYKDRDRITNDNWAKQLADHFLKATPMPSLEWEYQFASTSIKATSLEEVNGFAKSLITDENHVYMVTGPDKEGVNLPSEQELLLTISEVNNKSIEPYQDNAGDEPLLNKSLAGKKVVQQFDVAGMDAKGYVLENNARVIILPTDFSKDEVLFSAFSHGGTSLVKQEDLVSANLAGALYQVSGIGEFSATDLQKKLSGKLVKLAPGLDEYSEGWNGSASPEDLETLLQLIYMSFESPRFDAEAFANQVSMMRNNLVYANADNGKAFQDSIKATTTNHHQRALFFNEAFVNSINYSKVVEAYKDRFNDAADFTFVFVGNINLEKDLPLITKYLGNISSTNRNEQWIDHNMRPPHGTVTNHLSRIMQVPKSSVYVGFTGEIVYNLESRMYVRIISDLLDKRYLETIRETEGGSYGVRVSPVINKVPYEHFQMNIMFDCDPDKQEKLTTIVQQEIKKLIKEGPVAADLQKIKENYLKMRAESDVKNAFWLSGIQHSVKMEEDFVPTEGYMTLINGITAKSIQQFAQKMFKKADQVEVVMNPID
ncbi:insulinase family protein [Marinilabiliaceae bacterium JC017]|nr:insulinase family protein [Marinilabiliaceae bacterium JC017]